MGLGEDGGGRSSSSSAEPTVLGMGMDEVDVHSLDDETKQFVMETHMENIGLFDFLGFDLASLASQYSDYSRLPNVGNAGRRGSGGMGEVGAFITTLKSFVGMGILTLPYAIKKGGYILGPVALCGVAALAHHCMGLLLHLAATMPNRTTSFGALGQQILGRWAKVVVEQCLILTQYGFAIADLIFIVQNVQDVVCFETQGTACPSKESLCVGVLAFLLPFTYLRSLKVLAVPVLMSNVVLLTGLAWVYYCALEQLASEGVGPKVQAFNWEDSPVFFGCAVFSFEGIGLVLPIQFAMAQPERFPVVLRRAMILLGTLFSTFGFICYMAYGADTDDMITQSIPQNKITSFLRLFYCLGIFFTYPIMLFPLYAVTESKYRCLKDSRQCWRRIAFRTVLVILTGVIGMRIPHFGLFLGLIGSAACSLLAFVLPALFHLNRLDRTEATRLGDAKDIAIIVFGVVGGAVSFTVTLKELIAATSGGEE
eukprot:TRINITY_DN34570_c0_g1_i1.p1 TRINITY_DN34570_c0_g1~~TRINITY_DN34570_c0_g1_i1.p1  ORF type:complete len:482 (-),score=111.61 TRINITY_DN34570_c0_g1_i1:45-1490(-)